VFQQNSSFFSEDFIEKIKNSLFDYPGDLSRELYILLLFVWIFLSGEFQNIFGVENQYISFVNRKAN